MKTLPKLLAICLATSVLVACGPATPNFSAKLDETNSVQVTFRFETETPEAVSIQAWYSTTAEKCEYTPRLFGIAPLTGPVPSSITRTVALTLKEKNEFTGRVPLPEKDKCKWGLDGLKPNLSKEGIRYWSFVPSMEVSGKDYLPESNRVHYCELSTREMDGAAYKAVDCSLNENGKNSFRLNVEIAK